MQVPSKVGQGFGSKTPVLLENPGAAHLCAARAVLENDKAFRCRRSFSKWFWESVHSGHLFSLFYFLSAEIFVVSFGIFGTGFGMVLARGCCLIWFSWDDVGGQSQR